MKHLIIMIASILLGIFLFDLIAGPGEDRGPLPGAGVGKTGGRGGGNNKQK